MSIDQRTYLVVTEVINSLSFLATLTVMVAGYVMMRRKYHQVDRTSFRLALAIAAVDNSIAFTMILWQALYGTRLDSVTAQTPFGSALEAAATLLGLTESDTFPVPREYLGKLAAVLGQNGLLVGLYNANLTSLLAVAFFVVQSHGELRLITRRVPGLASQLRQSKWVERSYLLAPSLIALLITIPPVVLKFSSAQAVVPSVLPTVQGTVLTSTVLFWTFYGIWLALAVVFALYAALWAIHYIHVFRRHYRHSLSGLEEGSGLRPATLYSPSMRSLTDSLKEYRAYRHRFCLRNLQCHSITSNDSSPRSSFSTNSYELAADDSAPRSSLIVALYACSVAPLALMLWGSLLLAQQHTFSEVLSYIVGLLTSSQGLIRAVLFAYNPMVQAVWTSYRTDMYERRRAREQAQRHGLLLCDMVADSPSPIADFRRPQMSSRDPTLYSLSSSPAEPKSTGAAHTAARRLSPAQTMATGSRSPSLETSTGSVITLRGCSAIHQPTASASDKCALGLSTTNFTPVLHAKAAQCNELPAPPSVRKPSLQQRVAEWLMLKGPASDPEAPARKLGITPVVNRPTLLPAIVPLAELPNLASRDYMLGSCSPRLFEDRFRDMVDSCHAYGAPSYNFAPQYLTAWERRSSHFSSTASTILV
ncbi:hypothetical protein IWQ60_005096 [Tieghemiomyces parasiticus]|uniref:Uncharacterized protein n=1 Tax=Tieghemiomyces parasiticus TaxID=78921 RepID=A0A9W8AF49_9FUNG|nr:hypothetical protein IWQ60_005096 [Tieghemiomyces parasiticus]